MKHILLVEDERDSARIMSDFLRIKGYDIHHSPNIKSASDHLDNNQVDLILMDILLRDGNGLNFVRTLRRNKIDLPVIFMTVCKGINEIRAGYELGCEDYLKKPVDMEEMLLRVRRVLGDMNSGIGHYRKIGDYRFNPISQSLQIDNKTQILGNLESSILNELSAESEVIVERKYLLEKYWMGSSYYTSRNLDSVIVKLRKRFKDDRAVHILSLKRRGYRLIVI